MPKQKFFHSINRLMIFKMFAICLLLCIAIIPASANAATQKKTYTIKAGNAYNIISNEPVHVLSVETLTEDTSYDVAIYDMMAGNNYYVRLDQCTSNNFGGGYLGLNDKKTAIIDSDGYIESSDKYLIGSIKVKKGSVKITLSESFSGYSNGLKFSIESINHEVYNKYELWKGEKYQLSFSERGSWTGGSNTIFAPYIVAPVGTTITHTYTYKPLRYLNFGFVYGDPVTVKSKYSFKDKSLSLTSNQNLYAPEWGYYILSGKQRGWESAYQSFASWFTSGEKVGTFSASKTTTIYLPYEFILKNTQKKLNNKPIEITLENLSDAKNNFKYTAIFDDAYFENGNSTEVANNGLLKLSALGAISSYAKKTDSENNAIAFLEKCGFKNVEKKFSGTNTSNGKSTKNDNNHGTIYCGWKDLNDGSRLFGFVVSGYSAGNNEWISNFNVGTNNLHKGFNLAANEINEIAYAYIKKYSGSNNKVWIMGHSRGAALTNLLAIKLLETNSNDKSAVAITTKDIYAYAFATPQYTSKDIEGFEDCIYNFISSHDFVPYVVPSEWGFRRAGTNFVFSNESSMKSIFKKYVGRKYSGNSTNERIQLVKEFVKFGKNQDKYVIGYKTSYNISITAIAKLVKVKVIPQDYGMKGIGYVMSGDTTHGAATMLATAGADNLNLLLIAEGTNITKNILDAHTMITYLSWIDANTDLNNVDSYTGLKK